MVYTNLATITCVDDTGTKRDLQLFIRWTDADSFDDRMFNIQRCQKVITALGNKLGLPVKGIFFANYCTVDSNRL
jgi:hypothetical protein